MRSVVAGPTGDCIRCSGDGDSPNSSPASAASAEETERRSQALERRIPHSLADSLRASADHSTRRAAMGEMAAARLAGMTAAKNEHVANATVARVSATGSPDDTP